MISKSILENFELESGTEVYVQCNSTDRVVISFDSHTSSFGQTLNYAEAKKLADKINKVLEEAN